MKIFDILCQKLCSFQLNCLKRICPCIYHAVYSKKGQYEKLKKACGFTYGLFLGLLFYEMIIVDLDFTEFSAVTLGLTICFLLGFGIAFSSQIRCISLLSIPSFGGKAGRGVLKAIVLAYIIAGPISNLASNAKDVARVFSCTTSLTYNLTKTRFELMFKPFSQAIFGMRADVNEIKDTVRSIRDITAPIAGELEGEEEMKRMKEENDYLDAFQNDTKRSDEIEKKYNTTGEQVEAERYKKKYLKKIETRCQDQLSKAGSKCRKMFGTAYDKCYKKVSWLAAWLLCWPMKLTFVCNIIESIGGPKACDPEKAVDPGFGEGYGYLKNSRKELTQNFKDVKLQYQIGKIKQLVDIREAADSAKSVLHAVKQKKTIMDTFFKILKRVLAFVFLKILIDAQQYHDKYLRDNDFDNMYITRYFRKIDARRKIQEKHTILPLKKIEKKKLIDPMSLRPLKQEQEEILGQTIHLLLEMITATIFVILDRLFYEILDIIRRHARIDYLQEGHHDMMLAVRGTGMIASLLRSVVKGFNIKKRVKVVRSNAACLPNPSKLPNSYLYKIYGTYFAVWLLVILQAYILRLRHVICAFYYYKREKIRVLLLYNQTLKRRRGFFKYMKRKVRKAVREQRLEDELNVFHVLRIRFPCGFGWLKLFACARRKCIICKDPEPCSKVKILGNFTQCPNEACHVVYCLECWNDVGKTCYACAVDSPDTTDFEDSDSGIGDE